MIFYENIDKLGNQKMITPEISKAMEIKGFEGNYCPRISLTYLGLRIYYWWFCYTALVLTKLFIVSVSSETVVLKDALKILSSYNSLVGIALHSTVPPVHEHHILSKRFWRNNA